MAFFKVRANLGIDYSTWEKISTTKRRIEPYRCRNSPPLSHQSPRWKLISVSERLPRSKIVNRPKFVFQFVSTKWYIYICLKKMIYLTKIGAGIAEHCVILILFSSLKRFREVWEYESLVLWCVIMQIINIYTRIYVYMCLFIITRIF